MADPDSPGWMQEMLALQSAVTEAYADFQQIIDEVVARALRIIPLATGAIVEMRDGEDVVYRAASGTSIKQIGLRLALSGSLSGVCIATGETQFCHDSETDPRVDRDACRKVGVRSMMLVPLPYHGQSVGVLKVYSGQVAAFSRADLDIVRLMAGPIVTGFANAAHSDAARHFAATFEQAAVGLAHCSPEGRFLLVNDRFCEIAGYSRDELVGLDYRQITHPADYEIDARLAGRLLLGRSTISPMRSAMSARMAGWCGSTSPSRWCAMRRGRRISSSAWWRIFRRGARPKWRARPRPASSPI